MYAVVAANKMPRRIARLGYKLAATLQESSIPPTPSGAKTTKPNVFFLLCLKEILTELDEVKKNK